MFQGTTVISSSMKWYLCHWCAGRWYRQSLAATF